MNPLSEYEQEILAQALWEMAVEQYQQKRWSRVTISWPNPQEEV